VCVYCVRSCGACIYLCVWGVGVFVFVVCVACCVCATRVSAFYRDACGYCVVPLHIVYVCVCVYVCAGYVSVCLRGVCVGVRDVGVLYMCMMRVVSRVGHGMCVVGVARCVCVRGTCLSARVGASTGCECALYSLYCVCTCVVRGCTRVREERVYLCGLCVCWAL